MSRGALRTIPNILRPSRRLHPLVPSAYNLAPHLFDWPRLFTWAARESKESALDHVATHRTVAHGHEHAHEELGFWRKYVFSTDHKVIGIQYAITGLLFLLFGF